MTDSPMDSVHPRTVAEWRTWLEQHHATSAGVWMVFFKQATGNPRVAYDEAVETALCFGWIDSKPRTLDAGRSMLWFSPRKKASAWSKKNKERIDMLIANGQMHQAGLQKVEDAKQDGSWTQLDAVELLEVPADLRTAFKSYAGSQGNFEAFPRSAKRAILEWISNAKTDVTRAKRVTETARLAAENVRANQWVKKT